MNTFQQFCSDKKENCAGGGSYTNKDDYCFVYDEHKHGSLEEFYATFPVISFELDGDYDYNWKPQDYLYEENAQLCLPFYALSGRTILGAIWMKNHDIIFDRDNNKVGFAESDCSYEYEYGKEEDVSKSKDTSSTTTTEDISNKNEDENLNKD